MPRPFCISVPRSDLPLIDHHAREAIISKRDAYGEQVNERRAYIDQMVGQLGNYGGIVVLEGKPDQYVLERRLQDLDKYRGKEADGLIGGHKYDFKCSLWRTNRPILDMRLVVPLTEWHPGMVYMNVIADQSWENLYSRKHVKPYLWVIGWARAEEIPEVVVPEFRYSRSGKPDTNGGRRRALANRDLHPVDTAPGGRFAEEWGEWTK